MAAQYDVNLEKCALLKCLCGSAFAQDRLRCAHLLLKSPSFLVIQMNNRITTKRCAFKQTGCALGLM